MHEGDGRVQRGMAVNAVQAAQIEDRKSGQGGDHYANHRRKVKGGELKILCSNRSKCGTFPNVPPLTPANRWIAG